MVAVQQTQACPQRPTRQAFLALRPWCLQDQVGSGQDQGLVLKKQLCIQVNFQARPCVFKAMHQNLRIFPL